MIKAFVAVVISCFLLSLLAMKIPIFRRDSKRWKTETCKQRFCNCFFRPIIAFIVIMIISSYQEANAPTWFEEELESGEMEYYQIRDESEVDNFDIVYEIQKGSDQERTCEMIETICRDLDKGSSKNKVYSENDGYIIKENGAIVGIVAVFEKPHGILLKFNWWVV